MRTVAKFRSRCPVCDEPIEVGAPIGADIEAFVHVLCLRDLSTDSGADVCPGCGMQATHIVDGRCRDCRQDAA